MSGHVGLISSSTVGKPRHRQYINIVFLKPQSCYLFLLFSCANPPPPLSTCHAQRVNSHPNKLTTQDPHWRQKTSDLLKKHTRETEDNAPNWPFSVLHNNILYNILLCWYKQQQWRNQAMRKKNAQLKEKPLIPPTFFFLSFFFPVAAAFYKTLLHEEGASSSVGSREKSGNHML